MFVSEAWAQSAGGAGGGDMLLQFAPLILIFVVFYFLLIRPQQKKAKEHQNMVNELRRGDQVIAAGGIKGKVSKVEETEVQLEIAEGVKIRVIKTTVQAVLGKGEPAKKDADKAEKDEKKD